MNVIKRVLRNDGYLYLLLEAGGAIRLERLVPHYLIRRFPELIHVNEGGREVEVVYPFMGSAQFKLGRTWREFFVTHRLYGETVRDCVRLGVEAWRFVRKEPAGAFIARLPGGVEDGTEVSGIHLFAAEWMVLDCVAVG